MNSEHRMLSKTYLLYLDTFFEKKLYNYPREPQQKLFEAMRYSVLAGGKRIRPIMVFDFCRMCGERWPTAVHFAAAVEFVHTYSLIHDDLPCMDNDDFRRGKPTNHKVFGEATAVLAGDALLTGAFSFLTEAPFSSDTRIHAVRVLSRCAGSLGMVGGQQLDMENEERDCTETDILDAEIRKTGDLLCAACVLGVIAGYGNHEQYVAAADFGKSVGLAFQIRDDILNVIGDSEKLGKSTGTDVNKKTFVDLYGVEKCEKLVQEYTERAISRLDYFEDTEFMKAFALELVNRTV